MCARRHRPSGRHVHVRVGTERALDALGFSRVNANMSVPGKVYLFPGTTRCHRAGRAGPARPGTLDVGETPTRHHRDPTHARPRPGAAQGRVPCGAAQDVLELGGSTRAARWPHIPGGGHGGHGGARMGTAPLAPTPHGQHQEEPAHSTTRFASLHLRQ